MQSQFNVLGLAAQLARPIAFGWLPRQLVYAALANAVLRYEFYDEDFDRALVTSWHITLQLVDRITVERRQAAWSKAGRRAVVDDARRAVWRAACAAADRGERLGDIREAGHAANALRGFPIGDDEVERILRHGLQEGRA